MTFEKNEVRTGLLVLVTLGVLIAASLLLGAPGLFHKQKNYSIFFDNAAGVKPGAGVLLAGRRVGSVITIESPVAKTIRPTKFPDYEVRITVRLDRDAKIYRDATPRMAQLGLLGEQIIDFIEGNESAGFADPGYTFNGTRSPDFSESIPKIIRILEPVAATATLTLDDLRKTIGGLNVFFDRQGELQGALAQIKQVGANFSQLTSKEGSLTQTMQNLQGLTAGLNDKDGALQTALVNLQKTTGALNRDNNLEKILANFQQASVRLDNTTKQANALIASVTPSFHQSATNFEQMTDTLKREPWRLIWKGSTKEYPATTTVSNVPASQGDPETLVTREGRRTASSNRGDGENAGPAASANDTPVRMERALPVKRRRQR